MTKTRLSAERIDIFGGMVHNESRKLPGHEARMRAHEERIHTALGPLRRSARSLYNQSFTCLCTICANYRKTNTVGPEH